MVKNIFSKISHKYHELLLSTRILLWVVVLLVFSSYATMRFIPMITTNIHNDVITNNEVDILSIKVDSFLKVDNDLKRTNAELPQYTLKGFDPYKNSLSFKNFGSTGFSQGHCFGISLLEKYLYTNEINSSSIIDKSVFNPNNIPNDLFNVKLSNDSIKFIFPEQTDSSKTMVITKSNIFKNRSYSEIVSKSLKSKNVLEKSEEIAFVEKKLNNYSLIPQEELKDLFTAIEYFQLNARNTPSIYYLPSKHLDKKVAYNYEVEYWVNKLPMISNINYKFKRNVQVTDITNRIDRNDPVIISFVNRISGHSVLGYRYEYVNENTVKVYVLDSNLPLFELNDNNNKYNKEILENTYVYFTKNENGNWLYKYNPCINGNYIYSGFYSSYTPETIMLISK